MICIPLKTWDSWTVEERAQVTQYYEATGTKWYIQIDDKPRTLEVQKDHDEYLEDMSLGGEPYKP